MNIRFQIVQSKDVLYSKIQNEKFVFYFQQKFTFKRNLN